MHRCAFSLQVYVLWLAEQGKFVLLAIVTEQE